MGLYYNQFARALLAGGTGAGLSAPANLVFKLEADAIPPQADNTPLASWTDQISGLAATQATPANQPMYRTSRTGGKAAVQFTGLRWLSGAFPALKAVIDSKTYTVLIVFANQAVASNGALFGNSAGGNSFALQATGATVGRFDGGNVAMSVPYASTAFATLGYSSSNTKVYPGQSGAGLERLFINGCCKQSNTVAGPATSAASGNFGVGAFSDVGSFAVKADVMGIYVWDKVLSAVEHVRNEKYVRAKYSQALPWAGVSSFDIYTGDSIEVGVGVNNVSQSAPYLCATARGRTYGQYMQWAVGGVAYSDMLLMIPEWSAAIAEMGVLANVMAFEWYNEKTKSSPAVAFANAQTYCSTARAVPGVKLCFGSSTSYNTDATDYATVRGPFNALVDANSASMCDSYVPFHSDAIAGPAIGNSGAYAANAAANWSDGVHLKAAGHVYLANAQTAGMNAMRA